MKRTIFFDLDGTLWKSDHPLLQTAWARLPAACNTVLGTFPQDFRWQDHAGSTDLGVVSSVVDQLKSGLSISRRYRITQQILREMDRYYIELASSDIRPALFPDTKIGLKRLTELGFRLGIITGNTRQVTDAKLEASGLADYFSTDPKLRLTGDLSTSRAQLLQLAWINIVEVGLREPGVPPLIYVADTFRDLTESDEAHWDLMADSAKLETRILLRAQPSLIPDMKRIERVIRGRHWNFQVCYFTGIANESFLEIINSPGLYEGTYLGHGERLLL